jgi:hypothetical protein
VSATRGATRMLRARVTMRVRVVSRMAMSSRRHSGIRGQKSLVVSIVGRREGVNENGAAGAGDKLATAPGMSKGKRRGWGALDETGEKWFGADRPSQHKDLLDSRSIVYYSLKRLTSGQRFLRALPLFQHMPGAAFVQCLVIHSRVVGERELAKAKKRTRRDDWGKVRMLESTL